MFVTLLGALGSTAALVAIYYLLPLDRSSIGVVIGILAVGLLALVGLVVRASSPARLTKGERCEQQLVGRRTTDD